MPTDQGEKDIQSRADEHYALRFDEEMRALIGAADDVAHDAAREAAIEQLQQEPLSFQKLTTHHVDETIVWEILLGTGGPAERVLVTTDLRGIVEAADYQFQDWFEPWTSARDQDEALVKRYAELVGFYEDIA